jgi:NADH-ubiquinone oxidoreductase chain 2
LIPPLLGFFAKQQVLYAATQSGYFFLSIVAILVSVISASYYLQIIKVIHFPSELKVSRDEDVDFNGRGVFTSKQKNTANLNNYLNILYGLSSKKIPSIERNGHSSDVGLNASGTQLDNGKLNTESSRLGTNKDDILMPTNNFVPITNIHSMTISTLTLTILLFILNPSLILNSSHLMALTIFNYYQL